MLANPLLGAVKLTENTDFGKYKYSEYGIRFDKTGSFSFSDISGFTKIIIIPVVILVHLCMLIKMKKIS